MNDSDDNCPNFPRRKLLKRIGLAGVMIDTAPALPHLGAAHASGSGSGGNGGSAGSSVGTNSFTTCSNLVVKKEYTTVVALLVDTASMTYFTAGDYVRVVDGGFTYKVVASGGDVANAASVQLNVLTDPDGSRNVDAFGAIGDGVADDQIPMEKWLARGGGEMSAKNYAISGTLRPPNLGRMVGKTQNWSSGASTRISRIGTSTAVMVQVSTNTLGTVASGAKSGMYIKDFSIDGNYFAEVGLFMNYMSNESKVENITVKFCQVGILGGNMWYSTLRDLTAYRCTVVGISLGSQYKSTFTAPQINGMLMENFRAHTCGSRYNATTNPYGFGALNYKGGCGVLIVTGAQCTVSQITSETNYGAGVVLATTTADVVSGIYSENNAAAAVADGEIPNPYGIVLLTRNSGRTATISGIYMHDNNRYLHVDDTAPASGSYRIPNFASQTANPYVVSSESGNGDKIAFDYTYNVTGVRANTVYEGSKLGAYGLDKSVTGTSPQRASSFETFTPLAQTDWASGTTLVLATIKTRPNGQARASATTFLMTVNVHAYTGGTNDAYCTSYIVNVMTAQRNSTLTSAETVVTITAIGAAARSSNATLLGAITPTASVSGGDTITISAAPTSTGDVAKNSINCSGIHLGTMAGIGSSPSIT